MSVSFRSDSSSSSFSPFLSHSESEEDPRIKPWLMALKECTKSSSAESRETLRQLVEGMPSFSGEAFFRMEALANLLKDVAARDYCYDPNLHPLAEEAYSILYPPDDPADFSCWHAMQPSSPQRSSPLITPK